MTKQSLLAIATAAPLLASELPPAIPTGPVSYETVSYAPAAAPAYAEAPAAAQADPYATAPAAYEPSAYAPEPSAAAPITPAADAGNNGSINLNIYSTQYQVRGMGVTNKLSRHGYSSLSGSYTLPNRNLLSLGLQQRLSGTYGAIWGAGEALGDAPLFNANYAIGKEIFPNLLAEIGYSLRYGGLEGYMARFHNHSAHRLAQDINVSLAFNDRQKGFFGSFVCGFGFQGLTGTYYDLELGYRFTDIWTAGNMGADLELSAGAAASLGYWGSSIEGMDAWRIKAALPLFTHSGTLGRDARMQLKPWVQVSWSGSNAKKFDRLTHDGPVDHFQLAIGAELGWQF